MTGGNRNDGSGSGKDGDNGEGGGWGSTILKVASAAAATVAVAGGLYTLLKPSSSEPEPEVAFESFGMQKKKVWTKPKVGWVKLNVDGSLRNGSAGCGGVLRDAYGNWEGGFAQRLDPDYKVDEVEKWGVFVGLKWALGKGVKKLMVECDNEGVVKLVNNRGRFPNNPLINGIRELLDRDYWEVELEDIDGDANAVADKLADIARGLPSGDLREFSSPPEKCLSSLSKDARNCSF